MNATVKILAACAALVLAGCATYRGSTSDEYGTNSGFRSGNPASPTFRPGMFPNDIRDPNSLTTPLEPRTSPP